MKIVDDFPPNYQEIVKAIPSFPAGPGAIYCYGDTIYAPGSGGFLSIPLIAHEKVHSIRQGSTDELIKAWWKRYLEDPEYRLDEELYAHAAEYNVFCRMEKNIEARYHFLNQLGARLAGPLYGNIVSKATAMQMIRVRK